MVGCRTIHPGNTAAVTPGSCPAAAVAATTVVVGVVVDRILCAGYFFVVVVKVDFIVSHLVRRGTIDNKSGRLLVPLLML